MRCSICDKEACVVKVFYKNNKLIDYYDFRCSEHSTMDKMMERKHTNRIKGKRL